MYPKNTTAAVDGGRPSAIVLEDLSNQLIDCLHNPAHTLGDRIEQLA